jgi:hypothetical protein
VQPADQLVDVDVASSYGADESGRLVASGLGMGNRDGLLVNIQTDKKRGRLGHG